MKGRQSMKKLAKILSLLLVISLLASMLATVSFAEDPASVVSQTLTSGENTYSFFRYTPADFNFQGNNTPLIYVLGDKPYTEETANTALNELGFRQIADKESCTVLFVSPSDGAAWGEDDYAMMQALAGNATDNYYYGTDYSAGVSEEGKFFSSRFRHYIFAEGTGAAFAKQYLDVDGACYYMPEWYSWCDAFGAGYVYAEDSLTAKAVADGWEKVRHTNRMFINNRVSFLTPYYYWDEMNVAETVETFETKYEEIGTLEYYFYVPETVDLNSKTEVYPLVFVLHGSGMHPAAVAQNTSWPKIAAEENLIVVSVNGLYNTENDANAVADLIDELEEKYAIDEERVYCTGFSKGARLSYDLGTAYPEKVAGIGLYEPVTGKIEVKTPEYTLPTYSLMGQNDFYKIFPSDNENASAIFDALGKVNGFSYNYDEKIGGLWGREFSLTNSIVLEDERAVLNENYIQSEMDGTVYTKLVDIQNVSHNVLPDSSKEVWKFLSQFSRNADGSISVNESCKFTDVEKKDWFYYPICAAVDNGMFDGTSATSFAPEGEMTRAMAATVLYRMAGSPAAEKDSGFTDVGSSFWYSDAVSWARKNGVVNGVTEDKFAPDRAITRQEFITMLYRYATVAGLEMAEGVTLGDFADADKVSGYAEDAVSWAAAVGLLKGSKSGNDLLIAPEAGATRAEAATLMVRFNSLIAGLGIQ